jgi:serine/threonine protein kinase
MGEIYVAEHARLPRSEALKILPIEVSASSEFRSRVNREADLAAKVIIGPAIASAKHFRLRFGGGDRDSLRRALVLGRGDLVVGVPGAGLIQ